jgi:hypothetical protein
LEDLSMSSTALYRRFSLLPLVAALLLAPACTDDKSTPTGPVIESPQDLISLNSVDIDVTKKIKLEVSKFVLLKATIKAFIVDGDHLKAKIEVIGKLDGVLVKTFIFVKVAVLADCKRGTLKIIVVDVVDIWIGVKKGKCHPSTLLEVSVYDVYKLPSLDIKLICKIVTCLAKKDLYCVKDLLHLIF